MIIGNPGDSSTHLQPLAEDLRRLFRHLTRVMPWNLLVPAILAVAMYDSSGALAIALWGLPFMALVLVRYLSARYFLRQALPQARAELRRWQRWILVPSALMGGAWAATTFVFFAAADAPQQVLLLTLINGVCVLALVLAVYYLAAFYVFVLPALVGQSLYFMLLDKAFWPLAAVSLVLLLVLSNIANTIHRQGVRSRERKRENQELIAHLRHEKERAELANSAKSRFLASAGHDLRQPVHSLTLLSEALRSEVETPNGEELVAHVSESVSVLDDILSALLEISRLDAGVVKVRKMPVDLATLIVELVTQIQPLAETRQLQLRTRLRRGYVYTDPTLLSTLVRNLLRNAVDFTQRGGVLVTVRPRGGSAVLQIWDTGPGIAPAQTEAVFMEFVQLETPGRNDRRGLGLGLSISRKLAALLGHPLQLKSRPGRGTMVELHLPAIAAENVGPVTVQSRAAQGGLSGKRLLIIDNEAAILRGTRAVLDNWGCVADTASSSEQALVRLKRGQRYDAYLCDYELGQGLDGVALLEAMGRLDGGQTPGILVTGNTDAALMRRTSQAGLVVLHKPVKPAQLRAALLQRLQGPCVVAQNEPLKTQ